MRLLCIAWFVLVAWIVLTQPRAVAPYDMSPRLYGPSPIEHEFAPNGIR